MTAPTIPADLAAAIKALDPAKRELVMEALRVIVEQAGRRHVRRRRLVGRVPTPLFTYDPEGDRAS